MEEEFTREEFSVKLYAIPFRDRLVKPEQPLLHIDLRRKVFAPELFDALASDWAKRGSVVSVADVEEVSYSLVSAHAVRLGRLVLLAVVDVPFENRRLPAVGNRGFNYWFD